MTFLELCQRLASECGVSTTGPSAVLGQTGRLGQIVKWTAQSDLDVQTLHDDWKFMRGSFTLNTVAGDGKYAFGECTDTATVAPITKFRIWCDDVEMRVFKTASGVGGETDLPFLCYEDWYSRYNIGNQTNSPPFFWSVDKDNGLLLAPKPDDIYTVSGDYMKSATTMAADGDTPVFPADYHMAVVYRGMMKYGRFAGAQEIYNDGLTEYKRVLNEMRRTQRPKARQPGPLA